MNKIWYAIGDFFESLFVMVDGIGNTINYFYVGVIFIFLVVWVTKMLKHRKNDEEHAPL
tara:strand:- start:176 stop:352 length:177 start_codon:yes stop_codon:yes gene_type:complete